MRKSGLYTSLERAGISFARNIPLAPYTTFRIGGMADCMVFPKTAEEAVYAFRLCKTKNIPCFVLGRGANLLVSDGGVRGAVICMRYLSAVTQADNCIQAQAGVPLGKLLSLCQKNGLGGLSHLCGIPATVGGAVAMNAGANGAEIGDAVEFVTFYDSREDTVKCFAQKEFAFGYRHSLCHMREGMILSVSFRFSPASPIVLLSEMKALAKERKAKHPLDYPSAGSTFRRPFPYFAPRLIEGAGLKGCRVGDAVISQKHAGFILNLGSASAKDVHTLITHAQTVVRDTYSVSLEPEIIFWGELPHT